MQVLHHAALSLLLPSSFTRLHGRLSDESVPDQSPLVLAETDSYPICTGQTGHTGDTGDTGHAATILELQRRDFFGLPFIFTNIAIGTPPQPFMLFVDLTFGGLAVRSVDCQQCGRHVAFDRTASVSCESMDHRFSLFLDGHTAQGAMLKDDLHLGESSLRNATFGAADTFYGENMMLLILADMSDGALGLAPPNATSSSYSDGWHRGLQSHQNFMHELVSPGLLEDKTMFLSLPKTPDAVGTLVFGARYRPLNFWIPLSKRQKLSLIEGTWAVDLGHVVLRGYPQPFEARVDLIAALTLSPDFVMTLPDEIARAIYDYLGAVVNEDFEGGVIPCQVRQTLPELTLMFGGQNKSLVLDWKDYTRVLTSGNERVCVVAIHRQEWDTTSAVMGLWLFQRFDVLFDMDHNRVGLRELEKRGRIASKPSRLPRHGNVVVPATLHVYLTT
ncbi:hypothetical protein M409DRAFT_49983 [Zasmidium cellare ATCC 36951]|uniref:Peptidase A1 domain-containing protein n=1 Tax=Zasmidium cellare ATCC 36951 TaxID=1080233 RepID=A0A6A6D2C9_ZASCE|nr:uncharacterized protein M409DRAFT_49983 [Zasmidium cellare ATCC 36951]KAF2172259.1 hypothetical protein M409DRAFT_49983 [Zasmidium cellare ATCC 36951]